MVDPSDAMPSFQEAFLRGELLLRPGVLDPSLHVHKDHAPDGQMRLTYARFEGQVVTALVMVCRAEPLDDLLCFQFGVAVPEQFRRQGRAKDLMSAAIRELQNGLGGAGVREFYIEAVIHPDNVASRRVAETCISPAPASGTDDLSGQPALQYIAKLEAKALRPG